MIVRVRLFFVLSIFERCPLFGGISTVYRRVTFCKYSLFAAQLESALCEAAQSGLTDKVAELLDSGVDVNTRDQVLVHTGWAGIH